MKHRADNLNASLTPTQMLILDVLSGDFKKRILIFLCLCQDLRSIIAKENSYLMKEECILFDGFFYHKLQLLGKFEKSIPPLFESIQKEAPNNVALKLMLMEEMKNVKSVLNINTAFHMYELKLHTQKVTAIRENIIGRVMQEKAETVCH